jgi:hypothetical protein
VFVFRTSENAWIDELFIRREFRARGSVQKHLSSRRKLRETPAQGCCIWK